jgi:uncharacterized membrane protein
MATTIENYVPVSLIEKQKRQAVWVWGIGLLVAAIWLLLIVAAPIARNLGAENIAAPIYSFYSWICHQLSDRSFHYHGHQFAVCARCFGFYGGFLAGFIAYPLFRKIHTVEPFPRIWLLLATVPIAIDFSLTFFSLWENTHLSRSVTGAILGVACAVFIIPALVEINNLIRMKKPGK